MKVTTQAIAGTLESSDAQVMILPHSGSVKVELTSSVFDQYGAHIIALAKDTAKTLGLEDGLIKIVDKGALDCTIKARIETAFYRTTGQTADLPWEVL